MSDLYDLIEPVTASFGYSDRVGPDVRAALLARIGSLTYGAKGQLFARKWSVPPTVLFEHAAVVELNNLWDANEKTFLSAVILLNLLYHRRTRGLNDKLQHVLVIEDAHRLLNVQSAAVPNSKPAALFHKFFAELLSEVGEQQLSSDAQLVLLTKARRALEQPAPDTAPGD